MELFSLQILSWWKMRWKPLGLGSSSGSSLSLLDWHGQVTGIRINSQIRESQGFQIMGGRESPGR